MTTIEENKNKDKTKKRKALILAIIFLISSLANLFFSIFIGSQNTFWQMDAQIGIMLILSISIIIALVWIQHDRTESGIWLIIGSFLFATLSTSALQANLGVILGAITISSVLIIATVTLSQKLMSRAVIMSIFVAILIVSIDFIDPSFRLPAREISKIYISTITGALLFLSFVIFVQMAFKNYLMRTKLIIALLTSSILTAVVFAAFFFFSGSYASLEEQIIEHQKNQLTQHLSAVDQAITVTQVDILFLSQSTNLKRYIRATINKESKENIASLREELDSSLLVFAQTHPNYAQLRYIDTSGQEISRVDNDRSGNSTVTPLSNLQNKADRYYFVNSIYLQKGDVYMSQLDLNVEDGEIELPHKPKLRLATPVVVNGTTYGEIVLNLYAESFLAPLGETKPFAFLVDKDGYYLYHPVESKRWGRDLGTEINIKKDLPQLAESMFSQDAGFLETSEELFTYHSLTTLEETTPRWYIVNYRPAEEAFASLNRIISLSIWFLLGTLLLVSGIGISISQTATKPLVALTNTALDIAEGNINIEASTQSKDEIGILAQAFNSMTTQLRNIIDSLELRVSERTLELEKRSSYLEISAKVSHAVAEIIDPDKLISESVNLIQQNFNFYYVGLFLLDEEKEYAVLQAGTGKAGQIMLERKHRIKKGEGMIGWSIAKSKARIALDVGEDAIQFANPNLPKTRSEGALPLRSRGRVRGALTVQSVEEAAFTSEIISVLQTMTDQIALALDNAELFAKSKDALEAERKAYGQLSQEDWYALLQRKNIPRYISDAPNKSYPLEDADKANLPETEKNDDLIKIIPIKIRGHVLGGIKLYKEKESDSWTKEELELAETLAEQVSISLESARLFDQSQRRAARERVIGEASAKMRETLNIESVLTTATKELHKALGGIETKIWIDADKQE